MYHILIVLSANVDVRNNLFYEDKKNAIDVFSILYEAKNDQKIFNISDDYGHSICASGYDLLLFGLTDVVLEHEVNVIMTELQEEANKKIAAVRSTPPMNGPVFNQQ